MSALEAAEQLLAKLSRAEKAQVLQWAARDLGDAFPGIESRPGVCGGEPCIVRTRIPAWVLEQARRLGTSEAELLRIIRHSEPRTWPTLGLTSGRIGTNLPANRGERGGLMASLYSNENFPLPVVEKLRALGHDVLTIQEAGKADQALPDKEILALPLAKAAQC